MKHTTKGLTRPCNGHDIFISGNGLQCGNCMAYEEKPVIHYCTQCGRDMGYEWILGPVCGRCCRENHKRVTGR